VRQQLIDDRGTQPDEIINGLAALKAFGQAPGSR